MPYMRGARPSPRHVLAAAYPHQTRAVPASFGVVPPQLSMWLNDTDGDCHDDKTEILTEKGWSLWPEYDGQSLLGTMNQTTGELEFQAPTTLVRHPHDGPMVYSDHRRLDFAVTPGHRLYHRPYSRQDSEYKPYRFDAMDDLPCQFSIPLSTTGFIGTNLKRLAIGAREWNGDDLLRLIAVIVSDGRVAAPDAKDRNRIEFVCFREDRYEKVAGLAYRLGIAEKPSAKGVWGFSDGALAEWLRANTFTANEYKSPFKRVPDLVKVAAQEQIEMFLDFFGDQTPTNDSGRHFTSTSKRMVDDLQELLLRVGKAGTIYDGYSHKGAFIKDKWVECKNPVYTLHQAESPSVCLHNVKTGNGASHLRRDHYKGEVFCATVPNSTLVTRRNGRVVVTSNCVTAEEAFAKAANSVILGLPELFVPDAEVQRWASAGGFLNGAILSDVLTAMTMSGFNVNGVNYTDGPAQSVDYTSWDNLTSALYAGPVKIGVDADDIETAVNTTNGASGWYGTGWADSSNQDHCVSLCGYGTVSECYQMLGLPMPSNANATAQAVLMYTWKSIGVVEFASMSAVTSEAWLRTPTTPQQVGPAPSPSPTPTPSTGVPATAVWIDIPSKTWHNGIGYPAVANHVNEQFVVAQGVKKISVPGGLTQV